jgi:hypothetical protein
MADSFPLGVQHRGIRFHLGSDKDALRLLLTMVRDGVATVEQAMDCIKFEERPTQETVALCPDGKPVDDDEHQCSKCGPVELETLCGSMNERGHACDLPRGHGGLHDWEQDYVAL